MLDRDAESDIESLLSVQAARSTSEHLAYWKSRKWVLVVLEFLLIAAFSLGGSYVFTLPYCGLIFQCGCTWIWAGGVEPCNVFHEGEPHCPFCAANPFLANIPMWGSPFVAIAVTVGLAYRFPAKRFWFYPAVPVVTWLIFNLLYGLILKIAFGYPYFLWREL